LEGAELLYHPTRTWQPPPGNVAQTDELAEEDYTPFVADAIPLRFSPDATSLQMLVSGGTIVQGERDSSRPDIAWFMLDGFAGGRFVVTVEDAELHAEHTVYGSGRPVVSSTRGTVDLPP
jgi:hypothetical protein